jgi:8-oxo-dGTP diphosphatase
MPARTRDIEAAGAVVFRRKGERREVLLVHRPKYDDWSFPKGKLDRGEHVTAAAVREVAEETGLRIRLGRPLRSQRYRVGHRWKRVRYWVGRVRADADDDVADYERPGEIDKVVWVPIADATRLLTYPHDRASLREAIGARKTTYALILLRHGESRARDGWRGPDPERPLLAAGRHQADRLVPVLDAYGVTRVVSSPSARCTQTVAPYVAASDVPLETTPLLSEEGATEDATAALVAGLARELRERGPLVVCTHRPVLPTVFAALGQRKRALEKGELLVAHVRKGTVVAIERHRPR